MKRDDAVKLLVFAIFVWALPARAQYDIQRSVVAAGGGSTAGSGYYACGTIGQAITGITSNQSHLLEIGFWITSPSGTAVDELPGLPQRYELGRNHPNPFNPKTSIRYALPDAARVGLRLFDVTGREIAVLLDADQPAGWHELDFDASGLASGVYFYRLEAGRFADTKKLVLLK